MEVRPLEQLLCSAGHLDVNQFRLARKELARFGSIHEAAIQLGFIHEDAWVRAVCQLTHTPAIDLTAKTVDNEVLALVSSTVIEKHRCLPLFVGATQGPLPAGLTTRFEISLPGLPGAGVSVEAEWQAVDGDESREPRHGRGVITLDAEGAQLTIALRRADAAQTDERALTLRGAIEASALRGTFSDRLFAFRAGTFEGVVVS